MGLSGGFFAVATIADASKQQNVRDEKRARCAVIRCISIVA